MASNAVQILGLKETQAALMALPKKVQNALIRKGMTAAGRIVREQARALVPVDSGALKASIKARRPKKAKRGQIRREVAATVPHAHFVEKGTVKMSAEPFLVPALQQKADEVREVLAESVLEGLKAAGQ